MIPFIKDVLSIESMTYKEQEIVSFFESWVSKELPGFLCENINDTLVITPKESNDKPHIAFIGHSDVVPSFFTPYIEDGRLYGPGASDMKSAVAIFLWFFKTYADQLLDRYTISLVIYAREEGTPLHENGLYDVIQEKPEYIKSIDLAVIGEPTDNTIQLGCVGSIHASVTFHGVACHSARPWNGENALYKALSFIQYFEKLKPVKHEIFGVDFYDVLSITESQSEPGRTSIPGYWTANLNYRYAPNRELEDAKRELLAHISNAGGKDAEVQITDAVFAGSVIETELFHSIVKRIPCEKVAKQAWTDVAQLTKMGVPAFNFGPGLTSQAHKRDEYITLNYIESYYKILESVFLN